jgi:hypothetical protein
MSDSRVRAAIEQVEAWLVDPTWEPDAETLAQWDSEFKTALAQAEKAPGWAELIARAHAAGQVMATRAEVLAKATDQVKIELEALGRGNRALKGYGTSSR